MEKGAAVHDFAQRFDAIGELIRKDALSAPSSIENRNTNVDQSIVLRDKMPLQQGNAALPKVIVVDKLNHRTHVLQMDSSNNLAEVVNVPNAVGKNPKWTPEGKTHLTSHESWPSWTDPHKPGHTVGPGVDNPVGVLKMRTTFSDGNIMLHGTPPRWDHQIGTNASHGCVRHHNADILKIGAQVRKGDVVYIVNKFEGTKISRSDFLRR